VDADDAFQLQTGSLRARKVLQSKLRETGEVVSASAGASANASEARASAVKGGRAEGGAISRRKVRETLKQYDRGMFENEETMKIEGRETCQASFLDDFSLLDLRGARAQRGLKSSIYRV